MKLGDQDKSCAPNKACKISVETLRSWTQEKSLLIGIPMIWREQEIMVDDYYFARLMYRGIAKKICISI